MRAARRSTMTRLFENISVLGDVSIDSEILISEVQKYPCLYNQRSSEYLDRDLKDKAWEQIALAIKSDARAHVLITLKKEVQRKWKCLRDAFIKSLKGYKTGAKIEEVRTTRKRKPYVYLQHMKFLVPYIDNRTLGVPLVSQVPMQIILLASPVGGPVCSLPEKQGAAEKSSEVLSVKIKSEIDDTVSAGEEIIIPTQLPPGEQPIMKETQQLSGDSSQLPNLPTPSSLVSKAVLLPILSSVPQTALLPSMSQPALLPAISSVSTVSKDTPPNQRRYKKLRPSEPEDTRSPVNGQTPSPLPNRFDLLGRNWSEKMKTLNNDQRIFAEKLINDVFFEAELGRLEHGCHIVLNTSSE